jgi:hypothetical protein
MLRQPELRVGAGAQGHRGLDRKNGLGCYAFTLSSTATERIRAFRTDRIIALGNNQTPIPFADTPKLVLHCIPLESFAAQMQYDVLPLFDSPTRLQPMGTRNWAQALLSSWPSH